MPLSLPMYLERRRVVRILAVGFVTVSVIVAFITDRAAAIPSGPSVSMTPSFSPNALGEGTTSVAALTISGTEYGGYPNPLTKVTLELPTGIAGSSVGFPTCTAATLESQGPSGCPAKSVAGPAEPVVMHPSFGGVTIEEQGTIQAFFGSNELLFYLHGSPPVTIEVVSLGHLTGNVLQFELPLIETVPAAPYTSITSMTIGLGASYQNGPQHLYGVIEPEQCPQAGFAWAAKLSFNGGLTGSANETSPCPTPGAAVPKNTELPAITGNPEVGETLSCSRGVWSGSPTSFSYRWQRDGTPISGVTGPTYVVQGADAGHMLSCEVTAANTAGSQYAVSAAVSIPSLATCPSGQIGTPPNCQTPPPATCPAGQTGTPPNCTTPVSTCPAGQTGTPPNCQTPPPATCPSGQTGTPPYCKSSAPPPNGPKPPTQAQKLAKAIAACSKLKKSKRAKCIAAAKKRYSKHKTHKKPKKHGH